MKQPKPIPDLIIFDESDFAESDLEHPFAREAEQADTDELVLTAEQLLDRRKQEIAPPEWW